MTVALRQNVLWVPRSGVWRCPVVKKTLTASFSGMMPIATRIVHLAPAICCFAAATMFSGVKLNLFCNSLSGAEAPKVSMPML